MPIFHRYFFSRCIITFLIAIKERVIKWTPTVLLPICQSDLSITEYKCFKISAYNDGNVHLFYSNFPYVLNLC